MTTAPDTPSSGPAQDRAAPAGQPARGDEPHHGLGRTLVTDLGEGLLEAAVTIVVFVALFGGLTFLGYHLGGVVGAVVGLVLAGLVWVTAWVLLVASGIRQLLRRRRR